jgi:GT2 family glycosyltransferase
MAWFSYDKDIEVDQIATTFLMIRMVILKRINYFDESYKILYNDVDLCMKIKKLGYKIMFLSGAAIIHHGSQSTKQADITIRKIMYDDIFRYYKRNFGLPAYLLLPVLYLRLLIIKVVR